MLSSSPFPAGSAVAAYLRDSGGDKQDLSVPQQRAVIEDWCRENQVNLTIIFQDIAAPGSSVIGRSGFQDMIHHFHADQCLERGVILWKFSRFSRDIDDSQFYRADLRRRGYIVYSLNDNTPDNSNGRVMEALIDWMNARYIEDLSQDIKRGLHHNLRTYGVVPGRPPRGFKREELEIGVHRDGSAHKACRWVPDPLWWEKCAAAWQLRAKGVSLQQIHNQLKLYKSLNCYSTFFKNRLYLGELRFGDTTIPNYAPAMITQETWEAVQKLNQHHHEINNPYENPGHPRRNGFNFILSGLLHCASCGAIMNGKSVVKKGGHRLNYYYCSRHMKEKLECNARPIPQKIIENMVLQALREYVLDPKIIQERDREIALAQSNSDDEILKARQHMQSRLTELNQRISNLIEKIELTSDAPLSLVERLRELENERDKTRNELERIISIENKETVFVRSLEEAQQLADYVKKLLETNDNLRKHLILQSLIANISTERDDRTVRAMITFYNPETGDLPADSSMPLMFNSPGTPVYRHTFSISVDHLPIG